MFARLLFGYKITQCLYVAAKLDIADYLISGKKHIDDLAKLTHSKRMPLYRVMRCLVSLGVFTEENKYFSLNDLAMQLTTDANNSLKDFVILCGEELYQSAGNLLFSVQHDSPSFNNIYGMSHWEFLEKNPDKAEIFHNAMERGSRLTLKHVLEAYDFSKFTNIIDVGGGKGHFLCEILKKNTNATGVVFDLPNAEKIAVEYLRKNNLDNRAQFVSGNFFDHIPKNGDLYLFKVILHDWNDNEALHILRNCHKVIPKNGVVLIIEKLIEKENHSNDLTCLGDINMLVTLSGKERSLNDFIVLLNQANFAYRQKITTDTPFSLIEAIRQS